jgi:hypothetical protein
MKTLTKITVHDYKSGKNIGACKMVKYAEYDTKHPQPADPGAVLAGDWLTPEALGRLHLPAKTTVWFEEA